MPVAVTAKAVRRAAPCCRCPFLLPAGRFPPFFAENTPHAHIRHTLFRRAAKCAPDTFAKRKKPGRMLRPGFCGAGDRDRTGTGVATHGILSPGRLPISPLRQLLVSLYQPLCTKSRRWPRPAPLPGQICRQRGFSRTFGKVFPAPLERCLFFALSPAVP